MAGSRGNPLYSQNRVNKDVFESLETRIQDVIRTKAESRKAFPVDSSNMNIDISARFWEKLNESVGVSYGYSIVNVPEWDMETSPQEIKIPAMASAISLPSDEWRQMEKATLKFNDRVTKFAAGWGINEDIKTFAGDANVGVTNIMDQVNNSTDITGTKSVTSIPNIHATISGMFDQLDDALEFNSSDANIKLVVTRDVKKKLRSVIDTTGDGVTNGWKYAKELMREFGGNGSEILVSKYLNLTNLTFGAGRRKPSFTAGATAMAMYPFDMDIAKIIASNTKREDDPVTVKAGKYIRWAQRWRWQSKLKEGIITVPDVTI